MSVSRILQERYVIPIVCGRCSHDWNCTGKNPYLTTCPYSRTKLLISKNRRAILRTGPTSGERADQFIVVSNKGRDPIG